MDPDMDAQMVRTVASAVRDGLGLRQTPKVAKDVEPYPSSEMARPDLLLRSGRSLIPVLLRHRATSDDLARALLAGRLLASGAAPASDVRLVLLAKVVPEDVRTAAELVGVHVIQLDWGVGMPPATSRRRYSPAKLSSGMSWRVVIALLRSGPSSIRRVSLSAGSSYGWTHATVMRLIEMGLAERTARGVAITDVQRLLNGVAWERPLKDHQMASFKVPGEEVMQAARLVEAAARRRGVAHAFTGQTAAGIYTGYGQRFDRLYVYLGPDAVEAMREVLDDPEGTISLEVLRPDRDVFGSAEEHQGLMLVDPSQALLDVTGLGYGHWDLTERMVGCVEKAPDG